VVLAVLTGLLVLITAFYAWQTRKMVGEMEATRVAQAAAVDEMRRTREASIRPVLVPHTELLDPRQPQVFFGIKNVGRGPAIAVDVVLRWVELMRFRLRCPVLEPGEVRLVKVGTYGTDPDPINPETHEAGERTLRLTGRCEDVAGVVHAVDSRAPLFDQWENNISEELEREIIAEARASRDRARHVT